jgi:hypothetical protein
MPRRRTPRPTREVKSGGESRTALVACLDALAFEAARFVPADRIEATGWQWLSRAVMVVRSALRIYRSRQLPLPGRSRRSHLAMPGISAVAASP